MWKNRLQVICLALLLSTRSRISRVVCYTRPDSGKHANVVIRYGPPVASLESVQLAVFVLEKSVVRTFQR